MEVETAFQFDKWAEINYDLLNEIVQHIQCHGDYVRFRSAHKNWYLELPKYPRHLKLPLLLLPFDNESDTLRPYYHIEERKVIHDIELPETKNVIFRGSCFGWLIMIRLDGTIRMLEPFTRVHIDLPPISTFPDIADYQPDRVGKEYTIRERNPPGSTFTGSTYNSSSIHMQKSYINKIVVSSPPDDNDQDFMAVAIYGEFSNLCYCRRGDRTWSNFAIQKSIYCDVIFHKEKVYGVTFKGHVCEFNRSTMVKTTKRIPPHISHESHDYCYMRYLVVIDGDLLLVTRHIRNMRFTRCTNYGTTGFHLYKLESKEGEEARWSEIKSLGNYVLVLGFNDSTSLLPHPISNDKGNRIYYSDDYTDVQYVKNKGGHDNGVFDFKNQTIHHFFPNSNLIRPHPIWLLLV